MAELAVARSALLSSAGVFGIARLMIFGSAYLVHHIRSVIPGLDAEWPGG